MFARVDGPLTHGFFVVPTALTSKAGAWHRDDGLPHTLEHLIFMGSRDYPYKGLLDSQYWQTRLQAEFYQKMRRLGEPSFACCR